MVNLSEISGTSSQEAGSTPEQLQFTENALYTMLSTLEPEQVSTLLDDFQNIPTEQGKRAVFIGTQSNAEKSVLQVQDLMVRSPTLKNFMETVMDETRLKFSEVLDVTRSGGDIALSRFRGVLKKLLVNAAGITSAKNE